QVKEPTNFDQARRSLLMLKNIRTIDFRRKTFNYTATTSSTYQKSETGWSVAAEVNAVNIFKERDDRRYFRNIEAYTLRIDATNRELPQDEKIAVVVTASIRNESAIPATLRQYAN